MLRPISTLSLPASVITKLQESGFLYIEDILICEAARREANNILRQWGKGISESWDEIISPPTSQTALDIWQIECSERNIITFCEQVDEVLNGGIPLRRITEFCGAPGTGKTQFCLQLCVSVQVPRHLGGLAGEAVFIDTDSGFSPSRLKEIAKSCVEHCEVLQQKSSSKEAKHTPSLESMLDGVHYIAVNSVAELLATVSVLEDFLSQNEKVCIIIIDSLAFTFRYDSTSSKLRTSHICRLMSELQSLALKFNLAVVVTNHLTTLLEVSAEGGNISKSSLIPSLGEGFAHFVGLRLMIGPAPSSITSVIHGERPFMLLLTKSVDLPQASALYQIEEGGIRDVT